MALSFYKKASLGLAIGLCAALILFILVQKNNSQHLPSIEDTPPSHPARITGLKYSAYEEGRLLSRMQAEEFEVRPRKFWVFNIRPWNEAVIVNAKLEVHLSENTPSEGDIFLGKFLIPDYEEGTATSKGMGLITRVVIKGLVLEIYRENKPSVIARARGASIDLRTKEARLISASLQGVASKKRIESRLMIWENSEKVFKIPGEYVAFTPTGMRKGREVKVDMDLSLRALKP